MRAIHSPAKGGAWVLTALLVTTACQSDLKPSSPGLEQQIRENTLVAERDSLILEVAANGRLLTEIQSEFEKVAPVTVTVGGPMESAAYASGKEQRQVALERVRGITTRLKGAESRLASTEQKVRKLTGVRDSLSGSVQALVAVVEEQKATVASLTAQLDLLLTEHQILTESLYRLADAQNTAYFVVGTRKDLIARGVLVEDGHRSVPLVGRRGVQPARELPLAEFTSIDRNAVRELPLPNPDREYRIVSRQNLTRLASARGNGRVQGAISIESPAEFWEGSKYLIVVEQ